jgi:hypothetical protein
VPHANEAGGQSECFESSLTARLALVEHANCVMVDKRVNIALLGSDPMTPGAHAYFGQTKFHLCFSTVGVPDFDLVYWLAVIVIATAPVSPITRPTYNVMAAVDADRLPACPVLPQLRKKCCSASCFS